MLQAPSSTDRRLERPGSRAALVGALLAGLSLLPIACDAEQSDEPDDALDALDNQLADFALIPMPDPPERFDLEMRIMKLQVLHGSGSLLHAR